MTLEQASACTWGPHTRYNTPEKVYRGAYRLQSEKFKNLLLRSTEFRPPKMGERCIADSGEFWVCNTNELLKYGFPRFILDSNKVEPKRLIFEECGWDEGYTHLISIVTKCVVPFNRQATKNHRTHYQPLKLVQDLVETPSKDDQQKLCL